MASSIINLINDYKDFLNNLSIFNDFNIYSPNELVEVGEEPFSKSVSFLISNGDAEFTAGSKPSMVYSIYTEIAITFDQTATDGGDTYRMFEATYYYAEKLVDELRNFNSDGYVLVSASIPNFGTQGKDDGIYVATVVVQVQRVRG